MSSGAGRAVWGIGVLLLGGLTVPAVFADWQDDAGFTTLETRLGGAVPTGDTIDVTHVEGTDEGKYLPNSGDDDFLLPDKNFIDQTGGLPYPSSHATTVGQYFYGNQSSMSPGIMTIDVYEATDCLLSGLFNTYSSHVPATDHRRIQNHSYIGTFSNDEIDTDVLRRVDLLAARDGVVVVCGVNNGAGSTMPKLLCSAYNAIAVGRTDGGSSYGPAGLDGAGRVKPDMVAPGSTTSWSSPMVASSAALLLETADASNILAELEPAKRKSAKALLVKALLMAGATKDEFTDWRKGFQIPATDGTVPQDYRYGAGELNIDNSHRILSAGQQFPDGENVDLLGWNVDLANPAQNHWYYFEIPEGYVAERLSVMLVWNRSVEFFIPPDLDQDGDVDCADFGQFQACANGPCAEIVQAGCSDADFDWDGDVDQSDFGLLQACFSGEKHPYLTSCASFIGAGRLGSRLADLNLRLYGIDGDLPGELLDLSVSSIDNVEHLFQVGLGCGRYALEVSADISWQYAIAWEIRLASATGYATRAEKTSMMDTPPSADRGTEMPFLQIPDSILLR